MPLDFPSSPTNGQYYNGFVWNDANQTWDSAYAPRAATIPISSPNVVINGAFDYLQRAGSYTITGSHFDYRTADRWILSCTASGSTNISNSINAFPDGSSTIDGQNLRFFMRHTVNTVGTATAYGMLTRIEDVRTLAGQTATLSFWVRGTQNTTITPYLIQYFGSGGSSDTSTAGTVQTITTSWERKTVTFTVPSVASKTVNNVGSFLQLQLNFNSVTTGTLDIAGVQLEGGSVATDFRRAGGTLQGELAACQRYCYEPHGGHYLSASTFGDVQTAQSTTVTSGTVTFAVPMRAKPSMTIAAGSDQFRLGYPGTFVISGVSFNDSSRQQAMLTVGSSGLTFGTGYHFYLQNDRSVPQLLFSAEL